MKSILTVTLACLLSVAATAQNSASYVRDIKIIGYLGTRINESVTGRIMAQDLDHIIEPFKNKEETRLWQSEFWGKWMLGACDTYKYNRNPQLLEKIKYAVDELLKTQLPSGYIGNYAPEAHLKEWDVWGRKYSLLGLQAYYSITKDKRALDACIKLADHLMTQIGPNLADIATTGNYRGMAAGSILEPIVYLYKNTGDNRYLEFAKYIVEQWETENGPQLITKALNNVPVAERFLPVPKAMQWTLNGHKAYEMMSCYVGLLELYKITGNPSYLSAVENTARSIIHDEINIAGSASATECFWHGHQHQTTPAFLSNETCVTYTWMQLCDRLYQITKKAEYVDQIEKTMYNALNASMNDDGKHFASYVALEGFRRVGERQCGLNINCCEANGPRGFSMIPHTAIRVDEHNTISVNLYADTKAVVVLNNKNEVEIIENTNYPATDQINFTINPKREEQISLALRIPLWSSKNKLFINDTEQTDAILQGSYITINRKWKRGDKVTLQLEMQGKLIELNNFQALVRGPVVLARDSRFNDGFVDETIAIEHDKSKNVTLQPITNPEFGWMAFSVNALTSIYNGDKESFRKVHFTDFGSAGNTWDETTRYRVWLPKTIEVADRDTWW